MIKHIADPELVVRLHMGDEVAFRLVFDRFHRKIYQFAFGFLKSHEMSEEVVQDTFLSLWMYRERLDLDSPIAPLLFTIARRTLVDSWRKAASSTEFREHAHRFMESSSNDTEEHVMSKDLARLANEALQRLSEQQQQVFKLSRHEGLSYDEIAERLHISKNTVKYHLMNALKILREHLGKHDILYVSFILLC